MLCEIYYFLILVQPREEYNLEAMLVQGIGDTGSRPGLAQNLGVFRTSDTQERIIYHCLKPLSLRAFAIKALYSYDHTQKDNCS